MKTARRAQSVSEYVICVLAIVMAAVAIQVYVRRGIQGRYVDLVQHTMSKVTESSGSGKTQYEPYYTSEDFAVGKDTQIQENKQAMGTYINDISKDNMTRGGNSIVGINAYDDKQDK